MDQKKYQITRKTIFIPLVGLLAFFLYIYMFNVDILRIAETVRHINLFLYVLAATAVILDTLSFSVAWYVLLKFLSVKLSMIKSFLFVWFGIFVDTLVPAESISGEISKVYLVAREHSGTSGRVAASLVTQRLIGMAINVIALFIGTAFLIMSGQLFGIMIGITFFMLLMISVCLVLLLVLCVKENWILKILDMVIDFARFVSRGRWKLTSLKDGTVVTAKNFVCSMREFSHAFRTIFVASSFSFVSWILNISVFYCVFLSIGYSSISLGAILVTYSIFVAVKSIPVGIPFEVGVPEITLTTLFILVGVPPGISATATILMRLLTLWSKFFIGFAVQQWIGITTIATTRIDICERPGLTSKA